jgi:hypothetical protein
MPESIPVLRYSFGFRDKPGMTGGLRGKREFISGMGTDVTNYLYEGDKVIL